MGSVTDCSSDARNDQYPAPGLAGGAVVCKTPDMDMHANLDLIMTLVQEAGRAIMAVRARGFITNAKADASPVTEADHAAEAIIVARLRQAFPAIPIVAEEEIAAGHIPDHADRYWVVDPLDGTREFAAGRDDFAVCIGLVDNGRPVMGAVGQPVTGAVFGGIVGTGAWKRDMSGQFPIQARTPPAAGIQVVASRHYADDPRLEPFLAGRVVAGVHHMGSALKFCRLAEGLADDPPGGVIHP